MGTLPIQAAIYKSLKKVKNGVTLTGQIVYDGTAPAPRMLKVNKDTDTCGSNRPSEELLVSSSGGIKNVVVSVVGIKKGKKNQAAGSASLSVVRPVRDAESISSLPKENQTEQDETHSEGLGFEAAEVDQEVEAGEGVTSSKARMDK